MAELLRKRVLQKSTGLTGTVEVDAQGQKIAGTFQADAERVKQKPNPFRLLDKAGEVAKNVGETLNRTQAAINNQMTFGGTQAIGQAAEKMGLQPPGTTQDELEGPGALPGHIIGAVGGPTTKLAGAGAKFLGGVATKASKMGRGALATLGPAGEKAGAFMAKNIFGRHSIPAGIGTGMVEGAIAGGVTPATNDPFDLEARKSQAETGAILGGGIGGLLKTGGAIFGKRGIAAGPMRQRRLHALERRRTQEGLRQGLEVEKTAIEGRTAAQIERIGAKEAGNLAHLDADREIITKAIAEGGEEGAKVIQTVLPNTAKRMSDYFDEIIDQGVKKAESAGGQPIRITAGEARAAIRSRFPRPAEGEVDIGANLLKKMGLEEGGDDAIPDEAVSTIQEAFERVRRIRPKHTAGIYGQAHAIANDASAAMLELFSSKGVTAVDDAKAFWAKWAPIRDKAFKLYKPSNKAGTELAEGATFTARMAGRKEALPKGTPKDVIELRDDTRFLAKLEKATGTRLPKWLRTNMKALSVNEREQVLVKTTAEMERLQAKTTGSRARSDLAGRFLKQKQKTIGHLERRQFKHKIASATLETPLKIAAQGLPSFVIYSALARILRELQSGGGRDY